MRNWEKNFNQDTLEWGLTFFLEQRIVDLKKTDTGYTAAVLDKERYKVSAIMRNDKPVRLRCQCPMAKLGRGCKHMAALLYAIDAENQVMPEQNTVEKESNRKKESDPKNEAVDAAALMDSWVKQDQALKRQEKEEQAERARKKAREKEQAEKNRVRQEAHEKEQAEMEHARQEAYEKEQAEKRAKRQAAREQRKLQKLRLAEEKKEKEAEQRRLEEEAEKKRQEELLRKQEEEEKRREEKRRLEEEARRIADQKLRKAKPAARKTMQQEKQDAELNQQTKEVETNLHTAQSPAEINFSDYTLLGDTWDDTDGITTSSLGDNISKLQHYRYFDINKIIKSSGVTKKMLRQSQALSEQNQITFNQFRMGADRRTGEVACIASATGYTDCDETVGYAERNEFSVQIAFSRTKLLYINCGCPDCLSRYYSYWQSETTFCPYSAWLLNYTKDYLQNHNLGDSTDENGFQLINNFSQKNNNRFSVNNTDTTESLVLAPRLIRKDGKLSLSFRIGAGKLFVIKRLDSFCQDVKHAATSTYGSSTEINHDPEHFTEKGRLWITFINHVVEEESAFIYKMIESRDYYGSSNVKIGSSIDLFGWRLDTFYQLAEAEQIDFEDKSDGHKTKALLHCGVGTPDVTMNISGNYYSDSTEFHGVHVTGRLPELYYGSEQTYYIDKNQLLKIEPDFLKKIEPLADLAEDSFYSFHVGRNHMSDFYYHILPQLQEVVTVTETEPEKFHAYLPPEVHFIFYLDAEGQNILCRVSAKYDRQEYSILDLLEAEYGRKNIEPFRDITKEQEIFFAVVKWLPHIDIETHEFHCRGEEELAWQMLKNGVEALLELGEVRCTNRFRSLNTIRHVRISVGVSVSEGMLDLNVSTTDLSREELLSLLQSYRAKKNYHRLEDGSFIDTEDPSVNALNEMLSGLNVNPKDFLKGNLHLPMYRTLYLDRLLEENNEIYNNRDSHFRKIVKEFKTYNDADFEELEHLSGIMRSYQKKGFKWLRMLESCGFGGILADDMGLGKTLQAIAVLSAAKLEGKKGVSLIVSPASLVFNWEEEFRRFAPELKVQVIAGSQADRQSLIEHYSDMDVLITSYDLLKRDIGCYDDKRFLYEIIDEAQYIKNHTTAAAKAVKVIQSQFRFALTGTPIENRLSELWSIFDYLMPGFLYGYDTFRKELETPIVKNKDEAAAKRLQKMVSPFILRRLKEDVLTDLPEKLEESRYVQFDSKQQRLYDSQVVHMQETIAKQNPEEFSKNKFQILAELTKLRQICCDPTLCFENYSGESAKLEACLDLVASAIDSRHRILLFSQFTTMLDILRDRFDKAGISYYTITGSTSKEKRLQLVKDFNQGDIPLFLISLKAGGVGLNLTGADIVIHYDPWWNQAVQNQATDRAHRIGQTKKVTVYKLIVKNTIEEKIEKLQRTKKDLADQIIGSESSQLTGMSREELLELLEI